MRQIGIFRTLCVYRVRLRPFGPQHLLEAINVNDAKLYPEPDATDDADIFNNKIPSQNHNQMNGQHIKTSNRIKKLRNKQSTSQTNNSEASNCLQRKLFISTTNRLDYTLNIQVIDQIVQDFKNPFVIRNDTQRHSGVISVQIFRQ